MNINYKQPQFELFPGSGSSADDALKPRYLLANLTLTTENLVVLSILGIMVAVFAYSLGVERGKNLMAKQWSEINMVKATFGAVPVETSRSVTQAVSASVVSTPKTQPVQSMVPGAVAAVKTQATIVQAVSKVLTPTQAFKYTIQVASYKDEKFARKEAVGLNQKGFETLVVQKGKYAILCVGKFNQKNDAMAVISRLKSKYKDCLVRSM